MTITSFVLLPLLPFPTILKFSYFIIIRFLELVQLVARQFSVHQKVCPAKILWLANLKKSVVQWVRSSQILLAKDLIQLCSAINYTFRVYLIIIVVLYWVLDYVLSKQFRFVNARGHESIVNILVSQSITNTMRLIFSCIKHPEWKRHAMHLPIGVSLVDNCWYSDNFATAFYTN